MGRGTALALALLALSAACCGTPADAAPTRFAAANWLCTPSSGAMCKAVPGQPGAFSVSIFKLTRGGMMSPQHLITGAFSVQLKMPAANSGGTATSFGLFTSGTSYLKDPNYSEISLVFYGNTTAARMMLSTNIYAQGTQHLVQFRLPFDPSAAFHTYGIQWSGTTVSWLIDGVPLRTKQFRAAMAWPVRAMRPQLSVAPTPWTPLKPNWKLGPVSVLAQGYSQAGCMALNTDTGVAGAQRCPGAWNSPLSAQQKAQGTKLSRQLLINDFGLDKA